MFFNYKDNNKMSIIDYMKMLKFMKWQSMNKNMKLKKEVTLDICYNYEGNCSYRFSIFDLKNINEIMNVIHSKGNSEIFSMLITEFLELKLFSYRPVPKEH